MPVSKCDCSRIIRGTGLDVLLEPTFKNIAIANPELRLAPASLVPPVSRRYPAAETDQNRAERPIPTLVFFIELGSKFSLRLERCTPPYP
jgi:hypothetical protein